MMRASGVLLPISSIPSDYGIGCFSKEAYFFVDQLVEGGQKYWQILPLGPTGYGDSPYQSFSTFAGNPYFIDLEEFIRLGLLTAEECRQCDWGGSESYVDYEKMYQSRFPLLRKAFSRFDCEKEEDFGEFVKEQGFWLEDYCLYMAIKNDLNGIGWNKWPSELKNREPDALEDARVRLAEEIQFYRFLQYWFYRQWSRLKDSHALSDLRLLPALFRLRDLLTAQYVYLEAIADYIRHSGVSRSSYLIHDPQGELPHEGIDECFRSSAGRPENGMIQEIRYRAETETCETAWRPVRPMPQPEQWFERAWRKFKAGEFYR